MIAEVLQRHADEVRYIEERVQVSDLVAAVYLGTSRLAANRCVSQL